MTPATFATLTRYKAKADSTSLPDSELLMLLNAFKDEFAGKVQAKNPQIWNMPFTIDLVANQREYPMDTDMLNRIVYLEIDLDDDGKYVPLVKVQKEHYQEGMTEANITRDFQSNPSYFLRRNAIYLLTKTVPTVSTGIQGVYDVFPANITDLTEASDDMALNPTTTSLGIPRVLHEPLSRRVAIAYKDAEGIELNEEEKAFMSNLDEIIDNLSINVFEGSIIGSVPPDGDNSDYGYEN